MPKSRTAQRDSKLAQLRLEPTEHFNEYVIVDKTSVPARTMEPRVCLDQNMGFDALAGNSRSWLATNPQQPHEEFTIPYHINGHTRSVSSSSRPGSSAGRRSSPLHHQKQQRKFRAKESLMYQHTERYICQTYGEIQGPKQTGQDPGENRGNAAKSGLKQTKLSVAKSALAAVVSLQTVLRILGVRDEQIETMSSTIFHHMRSMFDENESWDEMHLIAPDLDKKGLEAVTLDEEAFQRRREAYSHHCTEIMAPVLQAWFEENRGRAGLCSPEGRQPRSFWPY